MFKFLHSLLSTCLSFGLIFYPIVCWSQEDTNTNQNDFVVSPSDAASKSGNMFLSSRAKGEILLKTHIWGSVNSPGVHYVPMGTRLLDALSLAGGPTRNANLNEVIHSSSNIGHYVSIKSAFAGNQIHNPILKTGDSIFVDENRTRDNVTLLVTIGTFTLSLLTFSIFMLNQKKR